MTIGYLIHKDAIRGIHQSMACLDEDNGTEPNRSKVSINTAINEKERQLEYL
jgi:hypothetical protein